MHGECCDSVHRNLAPREGAPLSQPADQSPDRPADRRLEQHVLAELAAWRDLPGGGGRAGRSVRDQLERTIKASKPLGGPLAEARVARRLLRTGCDIAHELPTPNGRTCDFEVQVNDRRFYLHVKCPRISHVPRPPLPSCLRVIEQVPRPYLVEVGWRADLDETQLTDLAQAVGRFLHEATIGEELLHRDRAGRVAGNARVVATVEGDRAVVSVHSYRTKAIERVGRSLERAYEQFMPGGENVILVLTEDRMHDQLVDLALLGTHVQRWDRIPRDNRLVAHGRAEDGFWSGQRCERSRVVGWMQLETEAPATRIWHRFPDEPDEPLRELIGIALGIPPA
ncbi:MAG: hypothetical protein VX684_12375 [Planctomycetota bacterium]|nr:hypothetical protein [Planctomycetota bacterium]MEC8818429.1 hypothetical protein [Planctomycetota bacterium]MEC9234095.1 hypothetical protein [Planctomycetota bacterium]MED5508616.1 hypothetical protein [Planctomycetota bacterium]